MEMSLFGQDNKKEKTVTVALDEFTAEACKAFDFDFTGTTVFNAFGMPNIPEDFQIGLIVGASGSGKSTLLSEFGKEEELKWDHTKAIVSQFADPDDAMDRLQSVGLSSIPSWLRPYHVLSGGEKFRADLARRIKNNAVIDEYTSVVNRDVAKSCSNALGKYIRRKGYKKIVIASCHHDIIEWLQPDWVFNTDNGTLTSRGSLRPRPEICIELYNCKRDIWGMFSPHHYLSADLNGASRCFLAVWNGISVGFTAVLPLPSGTVENAWRGHRTVIMPDFQGLGFGVKMSNAIGEIMLKRGYKYYARTAHPRLIAARDASPLWKRSSKTGATSAPHGGKLLGHWKINEARESTSHEYIGANNERV